MLSLNLNINIDLPSSISVIFFAEHDNPIMFERSIMSILNQKSDTILEIIVILREYNNDIADMCQGLKALYPDTFNFYSSRISGGNESIDIQGEFIFICRDNETLLNNNKLATQARYLTLHPQYSLCFHNVVGSGSPNINHGNYSQLNISLHQVIKYYSPLLRKHKHPLSINLLLLEHSGDSYFVKSEYATKMRSIEGFYSSIMRFERRAPLLKNSSITELFLLS